MGRRHRYDDRNSSEHRHAVLQGAGCGAYDMNVVSVRHEGLNELEENQFSSRYVGFVGNLNDTHVAMVPRETAIRFRSMQPMATLSRSHV